MRRAHVRLAAPRLQAHRRLAGAVELDADAGRSSVELGWVGPPATAAAARRGTRRRRTRRPAPGRRPRPRPRSAPRTAADVQDDQPHPAAFAHTQRREAGTPRRPRLTSRSGTVICWSTHFGLQVPGPRRAGGSWPSGAGGPPARGPAFSIVTSKARLAACELADVAAVAQVRAVLRDCRPRRRCRTSGSRDQARSSAAAAAPRAAVRRSGTVRRRAAGGRRRPTASCRRRLRPPRARSGSAAAIARPPVCLLDPERRHRDSRADVRRGERRTCRARPGASPAAPAWRSAGRSGRVARASGGRGGGPCPPRRRARRSRKPVSSSAVRLERSARRASRCTASPGPPA